LHKLHPEPSASESTYWRKNVSLVLTLLAVWFVVSYGAGILFAESLNRVRVPGTGFPLGFWFAQQGSIYVFVALIFVYVWRMNRFDREFGVDEGEDPVEPPRPTAGEEVAE
jgi:putative solute:sodium symporter small subunit